MLLPMSQVVRMVTAIRFAVWTRRDLLLEMLALRHQLAVLRRSNRRFRPSDRLLWLILRHIWPQWRDALVLVQPATVERWRRDRRNRRWWRRSRPPGRPRIDSGRRDLIGRSAKENALWGAPRIHGELLKLGVIVSERTVSRYLRERPKRPSQTWRTFVANHLGQFSFDSCVLLPYAPDADDADVSCSPCRQTRLSRNALYALHQGAAIDWRDSLQPTSSRRCPIQDRVEDAIAIRNRSGRGPPTQGGLPTLACTSRKTIDSLIPVSLRRTSLGDHRSRGRARPHRETASKGVTSLVSDWALALVIARRSNIGEGSLTPWLSVSLSMRALFGASPALICERNVSPIVMHFVRTIWSRSCGRFWSPTCTDFRPHDAAECRACARQARSSRWTVRRAQEHDRDERADHHAIDARSVLGTVQGSPLRSDRAHARPSGLDGACAQILSRPLRDGRRCDDS